MNKAVWGILLLLFGNFLLGNQLRDFSEFTQKSKEGYNQYKFSGRQSFARPFKKEFSGYSGWETTSQCRFPVFMKVYFQTNGNLSGQYRYLNQPRLIRKFTGQIGKNGSLFLEEKLGGGGVGYSFKGQYKAKQIYGMWSKGSGKKGFCFYATQKNNFHKS